MTPKRKKRNELPNFKKIEHINVDVDRLLACFNLRDHQQDGISESCGNPYLNEQYNQQPITTVIPDEDGNIRMFRGNEDERYYGEIVDRYKGTYVEEVLNMFRAPFTRSRLIVKQPGAYILPHIDYDTTYSVRYYITLKTNPWAQTAIMNKDQELPEIKHLPADGSVWFFNNGNYHSAWNMGDSLDVRMIVATNGQEDLED